jgi:glucokinase
MLADQLAVGMDVGGTNTKIGLVNASGHILDYQVIPSRLKTRDSASFLNETGSMIAEYAQAYPLKGIGIALCSLIDEAHSGAFLAVNAPALNNLDIRMAFKKRFSCPVQVVNDVYAYALAEVHFGAGSGVDRLLCLALGTGLAIAVIRNGQAIETWGGVPGDAGRIILEPESQMMCNAGVHGSAEALCGTANIERLARQHHNRAGITANEVIAAAREGKDPLALQIITEVGHHVGHLLAILYPIYFPQRILVTGGTAEAGETLFTAIRERCQVLIGHYMVEINGLETGTRQPVEILKGLLGPEAAILGAAWGILQG